MLEAPRCGLCRRYKPTDVREHEPSGGETRGASICIQLSSLRFSLDRPDVHFLVWRCNEFYQVNLPFRLLDDGMEGFRAFKECRECASLLRPTDANEGGTGWLCCTALNAISAVARGDERR